MKHKTKVMAVVGVLAVLGAGGVAAASGMHEGYHEWRGDRDGHKYGGRGMRMLETYDANGDGALTLDEITTERGKKFKQFDADGDGTLTLDEYQGLWMDAMRDRMVDRFQKHDDDGDGKITEDDFNKRFARMMTWMDRNGDGKIDRDDHKRRHRDDD
ncbi:MAG: EF-hand domain-containing protein [Rhodospirillales bacterium]|nr:EF-hand domain-containing protein [Rhodospirillales bacterium]MBO6785898.1 EF-hand domain-containing protein [Rhodospirillales bacterium]